MDNRSEIAKELTLVTLPKISLPLPTPGVSNEAYMGSYGMAVGALYAAILKAVVEAEKQAYE